MSAVYEDAADDGGAAGVVRAGLRLAHRGARALYRLAYDVGDRRMIAGVHYAATTRGRARQPRARSRALPECAGGGDGAGRLRRDEGIAPLRRCRLPGAVHESGAQRHRGRRAAAAAARAVASAGLHIVEQPPPPKSFVCTYPSAANYDEAAVADDGSCVFDCVADGSQTCADTDVCASAAATPPPPLSARRRRRHCRRHRRRASPSPPSPPPSQSSVAAEVIAAAAIALAGAAAAGRRRRRLSPSPPPPPPPLPSLPSPTPAPAAEELPAAAAALTTSAVVGIAVGGAVVGACAVGAAVARVLHGASPRLPAKTDDDGGEGGTRKVELA